MKMTHSSYMCRSRYDDVFLECLCNDKYVFVSVLC
mgnify:CR=1 FL=1